MGVPLPRSLQQLHIVVLLLQLSMASVLSCSHSNKHFVNFSLCPCIEDLHEQERWDHEVLFLAQSPSKRVNWLSLSSDILLPQKDHKERQQMLL